MQRFPRRPLIDDRQLAALAVCVAVGFALLLTL